MIRHATSANPDRCERLVFFSPARKFGRKWRTAIHPTARRASGVDPGSPQTYASNGSKQALYSARAVISYLHPIAQDVVSVAYAANWMTLTLGRLVALKTHQCSAVHGEVRIPARREPQKWLGCRSTRASPACYQSNHLSIADNASLNPGFSHGCT